MKLISFIILIILFFSCNKSKINQEIEMLDVFAENRYHLESYYVVQDGLFHSCADSLLFKKLKDNYEYDYFSNNIINGANSFEEYIIEIKIVKQKMKQNKKLVKIEKAIYYLDKIDTKNMRINTKKLNEINRMYYVLFYFEMIKFYDSKLSVQEDKKKPSIW